MKWSKHEYKLDYELWHKYRVSINGTLINDIIIQLWGSIGLDYPVNELQGRDNNFAANKFVFELIGLQNQNFGKNGIGRILILINIGTLKNEIGQNSTNFANFNCKIYQNWIKNMIKRTITKLKLVIKERWLILKVAVSASVSHHVEVIIAKGVEFFHAIRL